MPRTTKIVNFSLPPDIYGEIEKVAKEKGTSRSQILREALKQYLTSEKRWQRIREWGEETRERLGIKDENDIDRLIHEFREENK
jgi:metal-responsive CopG/Arc/MetJ family transcriptional regulator